VRSARLAVLALLPAAGVPQPQPLPAAPQVARARPPAPAPQAPAPARPRAAAEPGEAELGQEPPEVEERAVGPTPGAPTMSLAAAVRMALAQGFQLLDSADAVSASRWREKAAFADFYPSLTPLYQRGEGRSVFGIDFSQKLPFTGGSVTATGRYLTEPEADAPFPRSTDLRLVLTQPLLRGVGPNTTFFELTNARRALQGQQRSHELARQRTAVEVAAAFYAVIAQRQLLEVARQSLERTERLLKSSEARLEVGLASKLDVFRAELQAAQARDAMVRSQAALATSLERFRGLLALAPADPVEPEAAALPATDGAFEPPQLLVERALAERLELVEARDQVGDARRGAALAKQNLLPQVDLNLGVTQLGFGSSFGSAWRAGDRQVNVFLSASYPLPQASQKATRAVSLLELDARERAVRQREIQVEQEVRQALRELEQIRQSVELQRRAVEVAEQQRRLAVLRYQRGLGSNFDVVDAESSLVTARSALVQLLTSYAVARLDLKRVTGTLDVETEFAP
jgi:outer membrane protein TolC